MRIVLQRVQSSSISIDSNITATIDQGLVLLVGIGRDDTEETLFRGADKIVNLRIFPDKTARFHHSILEVRGSVLVVPNFTLYADVSKGRRPEFFGAMEPAQASTLFSQFADMLKQRGVTRIERGVFGAHMHVSIINDGPVTMVLDF